jgi:hypothetical protein
MDNGALSESFSSLLLLKEKRKMYAFVGGVSFLRKPPPTNASEEKDTST